MVPVFLQRHRNTNTYMQTSRNAIHIYQITRFIFLGHNLTTSNVLNLHANLYNTYIIIYLLLLKECIITSNANANSTYLWVKKETIKWNKNEKTKSQTRKMLGEMEFFCTAKCDKIKKKLMFSFWLILRQSSKLSEEGAKERNRQRQTLSNCVQFEARDHFLHVYKLKITENVNKMILL